MAACHANLVSSVSLSAGKQRERNKSSGHVTDLKCSTCAQSRSCTLICRSLINTVTAVSTYMKNNMTMVF